MKHNYIIYRPDARNGDLVIPPNCDKIILEKSNRYLHSNCNHHHWTYDFVWKNFIPKITNDLKIPFNPKHFQYVVNVKNDGDFSYHNYMENINIKFTKMLTGVSTTYNNVSEFRCDNGGTNYHKLIPLKHCNHIIENHSCSNGRKLLLNTDSMSIPVLPILIPYFEQIVVLDNRIDKKMAVDYRDFEYTDNVMLMLDIHYIHEKHITNLK